jgi:peptidylprolyl isomerase
VDFAIGEGESPTRQGEVTVHYSGFLDNGALFDSSYFGGGPIRFSLAGGELIPGWIEGLLTMKAGGLRKLIVPPHLAYGEKGFADKVPPNATLVYDIELIAVRNTP